MARFSLSRANKFPLSLSLTHTLHSSKRQPGKRAPRPPADQSPRGGHYPGQEEARKGEEHPPSPAPQGKPSRRGLGDHGLELGELRLERRDVARRRHGPLERLVLGLLGAARVGRAAVVGVVEADDLLVGGDAEEAGELEDEPEGDLEEREFFFF